ncbi:MAG: FAD-dependent monooxygenase [Mycobacterium sp.]|nr:FAD-dependent monooxygenase [Mycobacterium sp.]
MSRPSHSPSPILIVGGGPTGMTLAIELARRGVSFRIIDGRSGPAATSRSFTLHARTLELYEQAGYADRFVERGIPSQSMDYHFHGVDEVTRLDFTQLNSRFACTLVIEQNVTEAVLRDQLAATAREKRVGTGKIEWGTKLHLLTESHGRNQAVLVDGSGREEVIWPDWVVGCDGIRSTVRTACGLDFRGDEYAGAMRMMDAPLENFPLGDSSIHYLIDKHHMLLVTKLPGGNYRVLVSDMGRRGSDPAATSEAEVHAEFQSIIDGHFGGRVRLGAPEWATNFQIWHRISTGYKRGHVLLAGDAAHIHSPAGGQGMNACIQDSFNLGWKLASVVTGSADESLLDSYELERRPVAQQVIEGTDRLHQVMMAHGQEIEARRNLVQAPGFNSSAVQQISGLAYTYRGVAESSASMSLSGLAAGDRAPDVVISAGLRLHELLRHPDHTLLVLDRGQRAETSAVVDAADRFAGALRTFVITESASRASMSGETVVADNRDIFDLYGGSDGDGVCLVRPDGYIGARCGLRDVDALVAALGSLLRPGPAGSNRQPWRAAGREVGGFVQRSMARARAFALPGSWVSDGGHMVAPVGSGGR